MCLLLLVALGSSNPFQVIYQWKTIDFAWPAQESAETAAAHKDFIPANNAVSGLKIWKDRMYVTVPRWKEGIPVTLGTIPVKPVNEDISPKIQAYPSWEMQNLGDCKAFQLAQSIEIDPKGRMWIVDAGRTAVMTDNPKPRCPPRLVILDLEDNGKVIKSFDFPQNVVNHNTSGLNDIVVDHTDGGFAYITDADDNNPGIVVYSLRENKAWKVRDDASMQPAADAGNLVVAGEPMSLPVPIDGIALGPVDAAERRVYWSPFASYHMFAVSTSVLKNNTRDISKSVQDLGIKSSQADGMVMSASGVLYFGLIADDAIAAWDIKSEPNFSNGQRIIAREHETMQWPDVFATDDDGNLWSVTNTLQTYINHKVNTNRVNYRIQKMTIGKKGYQYHEDGSAPELPEVTPDNDTVESCPVAHETCADEY